MDDNLSALLILFYIVWTQGFQEGKCRSFDRGAECWRCCRATGKRNRSAIFKLFLRFWGKSPSGADVRCSEQVVPWPTLMEMDDWTCCWHMERAPGSLSPSSRSPRCVFVCLCSTLRSCLFKEVRNYKLNLHTFSGGCQQLAAGDPSHTVRILRPGSQGHRFYQSERRSHAHHRRRLGVPVWDGASRTFWFRYGWLYKPFHSCKVGIFN